MAIKSSNQIKTVIGGADLQLKADPGESFLVKRIMVDSVSAEFVTAKIEKTTVGYFRVSPTYGNHLPYPLSRDSAIALSSYFPKNLLDLLFEKEIFTGYPVSEGETFILSGAFGPNDVKSIVYDIMEPGDIKPDLPNGSKSNEYFLINYGDTGGSISSAGDHLYNRCLNPVEFPSFPFGDDVPAKHQITIHGILGSEVGVRNSTPATAIYSRFLKMVKDREVLFDEDRNGLIFDFSNVSGAEGTKRGGGHSVIGDFSHLDPRYPLFFADPMLFDSGDELNIYLTVEEPVDGSAILAGYQTLALIQTVKRLTG